ncbi:MAG: carbonic anhydrase [Chloroflexi bacterium]|nr:carbonic anhydrase [Chloroflexota bacterium]MDA1240794.1 carbonic anhydrase [Chloroflexota bacterium]
MGFLGDLPDSLTGPVIDLDALIEANKHWAGSFDAGMLQVQPTKRMVVLTCMDSRFPAQSIVGLRLGEAHTVRNAGGRASEDAIRSLVVSAHALGTRGCVVIHHTNCGLHGATNDGLREKVNAATGEDASHIDFLPFADLEQSVRDDVATIRACTLLPEGYEVVGLIYDVRSGRVILVEGPAQA